MTTTFHRIAVVDWSAQSAPKQGPDSIWVCVLDTEAGGYELANPATRRHAAELLRDLCTAPGRTLLGIDVTLGFPAGTAAACGLPGTAWQSMWSHLAAAVDDDERNRNNRWQVAADLNRAIGSRQFWGAPAAHAGRWLTTHRPAEQPLPTWRTVEQLLLDRGRRPFPVWQLLGAGSVGSQALTAIPMLHRLRAELPPGTVRIWPFDTGFAPDPLRHTGTVVAEVWPSAVPFDHVDHPVKDARQVIALAHHLHTLLADGAPLFDPPSAGSTGTEVLHEEGWVLGVA